MESGKRTGCAVGRRSRPLLVEHTSRCFIVSVPNRSSRSVFWTLRTVRGDHPREDCSFTGRLRSPSRFESQTFLEDQRQPADSGLDLALSRSRSQPRNPAFSP